MPFDLEDSNEISVTLLDKERLQDLEVGDSVDGECGFWRVFRNKKDYLVTLDTNKIHKILEFKTLSEVLEFLQDS